MPRNTKTPVAILYENIEKLCNDLQENEKSFDQIARLILLEDKLELLKEFLIEEF